MKNLPKAVQVECVEFPFLQGAGGPSSTAVQQCIDGASVGHCHIFLCRELGVLSDACSEADKRRCGLPNTLVKLHIQGQVVRDG